MNLTLENAKIEQEYRKQESEAREQYDNVAYKQSMAELGIELL